MEISRVAFVFNPNRSTAVVRRLVELFGRSNVDSLPLPTTAAPNSAQEKAVEASREGVDLVIPVGGDGTAGAVAHALHVQKLRTPMAVYPGGTGNLFARSFYALPTPESFIDMVLTGRPQAVDVIEAKYRTVGGAQESITSIVGLGFGPLSDAISKASPKYKKIFGQLVYVSNVSLASISPTVNNVTVEIDGEERTYNTSACFAMNVAPLHMAALSRGCNASDGLIDLILVSAQNFAQIAGAASLLALGKPEQSDHFTRRRVPQCVIRSAKPFAINIDGEAGPAVTHLELVAKPGAVRMVLA